MLQRCFFILGVLGVTLSSHALALDTRPLSELTNRLELSASATALSLNRTTVSAQVQAAITRVHVRVSETVNQGDALVSLDCADYQLDLEAAVADADAAESLWLLSKDQLQRTEQLHDQALASRELKDVRSSELQAARAGFQQRKVAVKRARLAVSRCELLAPFSGVVSQRLAAEGQLASVGTPLITIVDTDQIELSAQISDSMIERLEGIESFWFESRRRYPVRLTRIGEFVDPESRNRDVRFQFVGDKPPPGSAGKVLWEDPSLYLPPRYLTQRQGQWGLFRVEEGIVRFYPLEGVTPGRPHPVELPESTQVVTSELGRVADGDAVTP